MKQVLVAIDEHDHADQIVDAGIDLAKAMSAKVYLIYVVPKTNVPDSYRDSHGDALPEHYFEDQFRRVAERYLQAVEKAGLKYEGLPRSGNAEAEILKAAKAKGVDYIVVGTRELKGMGRLRAIGSVSRNVIEKSTIPVLAVP
ncbi:MAG TPA: universal stress protein [Nitrososphaerales archaeon]|nr:universal stress protein [Nitrososphaerales archaeon]HUK75843.1 universal stress protein [Nitrososphaerales archaeon]